MNLTADLLSCSACSEFLEHSKYVYRKNKDVYRITSTGGMPCLWKGSPLILYPVLQRVCCYTIQEGEESDDSEDREFTTSVALRDPHRPLFYTELSARGFNILSGRVPKKHPLRRRHHAHKK